MAEESKYIDEKKGEAQDFIRNTGSEVKEKTGEIKEEAKEKATSYAEEAAGYIRAHPMITITVAAITGLLTGLLIKK